MMTPEKLDDHAENLAALLEAKRHQVSGDASLRLETKAALDMQITALQGRVAELRGQVADLRGHPGAGALDAVRLLPALHPAPGVVAQP
jgi:hypothetical protein